MLGLSRRVDDRLRDVSTRGDAARLVFVDAREMPETYQLAGRYRIDGDKVQVTVLFLAARRGRGATR